MNKRLERVDLARIALRKIHNEMHDAKLEGADLIISLEDGKRFWVRGYSDEESFKKEFVASENTPI